LRFLTGRKAAAYAIAAGGVKTFVGTIISRQLVAVITFFTRLRKTIAAAR
jgi:hypothetical protein